jgi:hypothetical protein
MAVFWDVWRSNLVDTKRRFRGSNFLHHQDDLNNGGSKHLRNYMAQHPRRQPYSVFAVR